MTGWTYRCVFPPSAAWIPEQLDELAREGWELVSVVSDYDGRVDRSTLVMIFKRPTRMDAGQGPGEQD